MYACIVYNFDKFPLYTGNASFSMNNVLFPFLKHFLCTVRARISYFSGLLIESKIDRENENLL